MFGVFGAILIIIICTEGYLHISSDNIALSQLDVSIYGAVAQQPNLTSGTESHRPQRVL